MSDFQFRCSQCNRKYRRDEVRYLCPDCGADYKPGMPLSGVLEAEFDYQGIKRRFTRRRPDWQLFSAVDAKHYPAFAVGHTPFTRSLRLAKQLGLNQVWIKNDGLNPSGSLKDRASFLMAAEANRLGETRIVAASTGNAASSLAAVCASCGLQAVIFVPEKAPRAKLMQMILAGARVIPVRGSYDDAFRLSLEYSERFGSLNRNTAYHPLTIEGKKTVGLEIFAQNGFRAPEAIVVPVGDGVIISAVYKAFWDLQQAGLLEKVPRLVAVQADSSTAIHRYITSGEFHPAAAPHTIADSISVTVPSNAHLARRAVLDSGGFSVTVTDGQILDGQRLLASTTGIFAEPAAAAPTAALMVPGVRERLVGIGQVVLLVTGHGLKDVDAAMAGLEIPRPIEADISAVQG